MARKKSSLDANEPVVVEGEEIVKEPFDKEMMANGKAEKESAVVDTKKQTKAEDTKRKRGIKICVI